VAGKTVRDSTSLPSVLTIIIPVINILLFTGEPKGLSLY
jgi:hypothetical protein